MSSDIEPNKPTDAETIQRQPTPGPSDQEDTAVGVPGSAIGTIVGAEVTARAADAKRVIKAIERTHTRQVGQASSRRKAIKGVANKVLDCAQAAAEEGRHAGGMEQLKGHFIEVLDNDSYNAKNRLTGKKLVSLAKGNAEAYDAKRIIKGKFAGGVQQKSSAGHVEKTIKAMEKKKPGSARNGVLRVPKDQVEGATRRAGGRVKEVKGMDFTLGEATARLEQGVSDVAANGTRAASQTLALGKAGATGALSGAAFGALGDIPALARGEMKKREFAENRAVDALESGTGAIVGTVASGAGAAGATALLGTEAGLAFAGSIGALGTSVVGAVGSMGTAGAAVAGVAGGVTATAALPAVAGAGVAVVAGVGVTKSFKRVRRVVKTRQQERRELATSTARELEAVIAEPVTGELALDLELRGTAQFSERQAQRIRGHLTSGREDPAKRAAATRQLRELGLYVSDWVQHGRWLDPDQFDALVQNGLIIVDPAS